MIIRSIGDDDNFHIELLETFMNMPQRNKPILLNSKIRMTYFCKHKDEEVTLDIHSIKEVGKNKYKLLTTNGLVVDIEGELNIANQSLFDNLVIRS